MSTGKTTLLVSAAVTASLLAGLALDQASAKKKFSAALDAYRGASEVNAALVLSAGAEIAAGREPEQLASAFRAAVEREQGALAPLRARPRWLAFDWQDETRLLALAETEAAALGEASAAVLALSALPQEEWSDSVRKLQESIRNFSAAHGEIIRE